MSMICSAWAGKVLAMPAYQLVDKTLKGSTLSERGFENRVKAAK